MVNEPTVNIVIPAISWNLYLEECLNSCALIDYSNFNVILVLNNCCDIPAKFNDSERFQIIQTEQTGISAKRNIAMEQFSTAGYYAFIDSDAQPRKDWLTSAVAAFNNFPDIYAVGGPDVSPNYPGLKRKAVANAFTSFLVSGPRTFMKTMSSSRLVTDLRTCNLIVKAEKIREIGGFDETLPVGEDSALCQQIISSGGKLYFAADIVVTHHARSLVGPFLRQRITAGYGVPLLISKHGDTLSWFAKGFRYLPFFAVLFLALGGSFIFFSIPLFYLWLGTVLIYFAIVTISTLRCSASMREIPYTALAIIIGNLGPGIGILLSHCKMTMHIPSFYRREH